MLYIVDFVITKQYLNIKLRYIKIKRKIITLLALSNFGYSRSPHKFFEKSFEVLFSKICHFFYGEKSLVNPKFQIKIINYIVYAAIIPVSNVNHTLE